MADRNARYRHRHVIPGIWLPGWSIDPLRRCTHTLRRNYDRIVDEVYRAKNRGPRPPKNHAAEEPDV